MKVIKKIGFGEAEFEGSEKALDVWTRIHGELGSRGYGALLPHWNESDSFSIPGIGKVRLTCLQEKDGLKYLVVHEMGAFRSRIAHWMNK